MSDNQSNNAPYWYKSTTRKSSTMEHFPQQLPDLDDESDASHYVDSVEKLPSDVRFWGLYDDRISCDLGYDSTRSMETVPLVRIVWFDSAVGLEKWVLERERAHDKYKVFSAEPVKTEVKAVFSIQR